MTFLREPVFCACALIMSACVKKRISSWVVGDYKKGRHTESSKIGAYDQPNAKNKNM